MMTQLNRTVSLWIALTLSAATVVWAEEKPAAESEQTAAVAKKPSADKAPEATATKPEETGAAVDATAGRRTALVWRSVVKVVNPEEARAEIEAEVKALGGFVTFFNSRSISVKLPPKALSVFADKVAEKGNVLEKTLDREDLTLQIAEAEGILKSKREILARTRKFLDDSDVPATLEIERTMTGLVMEIEDVRGRLRVLNDRSNFATADVSFEFRERDKIVYVRSPFEWLNSVDLGRFNEEF